MNTIRNVAYGIILGSLILVGIVQRERQNTLTASTDQGTLALTVNGEDIVRHRQLRSRQNMMMEHQWQMLR